MKKLFIYIIMCMGVLGVSAQSNDHNHSVAKNLDVFNTIYKNLEMIYVDTLDANETVGMGIRAMLRSLDPYTVYYPEEDLKDLRQMITGKYAGIGALIRQDLRHNHVIIDQPYPGMPALEAGLKRGDIILSIDDSTMLGKPTDYVSSHLRGDAGSTFKLKIKRPSTGKKMTFNITRRAIQLPSITYYGLQPDSIGYLYLNSFTEDCAKSVRRAVIEMKQKGMKSLVLDLRENPGGSVQEAIQIVNMFIPRDELVLTMKGKLEKSNKEFRTTVEPIDSLMPMVVLVNDNSASASEITAGALQDLDRAVVMGMRTYGKGLVQTTVQLPYNGELKVTTAKYHIPSGRCIQAYNFNHKNGGYSEHVPDSLTSVFHTRGGREVRDGGGIKPDIELKADTLSNIVYYLTVLRDSSEVILDYELDYISKHPTIADPTTFSLTYEDFAELKQRILNSKFTYDRQTEKFIKELKNLAKFEGYYEDAKEEFEALEKKLTHNVERDLDNNKEVILEAVGADIVRSYYYNEGATQYTLRSDTFVKEAFRLLNNLEEYNKVLTTPSAK